MLTKDAQESLDYVGLVAEYLDDDWCFIREDPRFSNDSAIEIGHIKCMNGRNNQTRFGFWQAVMMHDSTACFVCQEPIPDSYRLVMQLKGL